MDRPTKHRADASGFDPVFIHARREAIVLLIAFAVFFTWSVGVSYFLGYGLTSEEAARSVLGIPHWVFWGVAAPWLAANVFTFWFCLFYMADDPLGEALDEQPLAGGETSDPEPRKDPS